MICNQPITIPAKKINKIHTENRTYSVPCGVCSVCKQKRVQQWVFRLKQEQKVSIETDFVTFTYTDENLTTVDNEYDGKFYTVPTLVPDDLKNFWHRLRKNLKRQYNHNAKIKYYACGEYGGKTWRPHYHAIIFNLPTDEIIKRNVLWKSWALGAVHIDPDDIGPNALAYTAKYIEKNDWMHSEDQRIKKFSRMSQGLGKTYLTPSVVQWHRNKPIERNYVSTGYTSNSKQEMPAYYRRKIFTENQRKQIAEATQKRKLEEEAKLINPIKTEHERKIYADIKFNKSLKNNQRDGTEKDNESHN